MPPRKPGPKSKSRGVGAGDPPPPEDPQSEDPQPGSSNPPGPTSPPPVHLPLPPPPVPIPVLPSAVPLPVPLPPPPVHIPVLPSAVPLPPPPGSSQGSSSVRLSAKVYKCRFCGRIFGERKDLHLHKLKDHADVVSHLTSSTVAAAEMRPGFDRPIVPARPPPQRTPEPVPDANEGSNSAAVAGPSRRESPSPPKRSRRAAADPRREEEEGELVDPLPVLRNIGRNKPPKTYGRKRKVRGPDGVERIVYDKPKKLIPGG